MSDQSKTFGVLAFIVSFYILLSILESIDCLNIPRSLQSTTTIQTAAKLNVKDTNEVDPDGKVYNMTEFLDRPRTKALAELHESSFVGEWTFVSSEGYQFFEELSSQKRIIRLKFIPELGYWHSYPGVKKTGVQLAIIDGEYTDDRQLHLKLNSTLTRVFDPETLMYSFKDLPINITEVDQLDDNDAKECDVNFSMDLSKIIQDDENTATHYRIDEKGGVNILLTSKLCNIDFKAVLYKDTTDYDRKSINYSFLLTFVAIVNLYSVAKMIKRCSHSPAEANKISLVSIGFITVWDTYICLSHLYLALRMESLFHFFIMPAFWYFILFSIFEVKLLMIIWRARYWNYHHSLDALRRAAVAFYCKSYGIIFFCLFCFYKFIRYNQFLICMSLYLAPQIIHNAKRGGRIIFNENYMVFFIGIRGLLPLYFRGCSHNLYHLRPSFAFCIVFVVVIVAQILLIYFQSLYGSKFFIPAKFLPAQYNYLYSLPDIEFGFQPIDDCVICMTSLCQEPTIQYIPTLHNKMLMYRLQPEKGQVMNTPCNHKFHVKCLVEWMSIKLECPTCRAKLPDLE